MNQHSRVIRIAASQADAKRVADAIAECLDESCAVATFEQPDGHWRVDLHLAPELNEALVRDLVREAGGTAIADALAVEHLHDRDWVAESLAGLTPVEAGRFFLHGAHHRALVPANRAAIEIEAALAFGTGHHGTTRGCLLALDRLLKAHKPHRILDVGTGSGVLAIAAAKARRRPVVASDIDRQATSAARGNARLNGAGPLVRVLQAAGLSARTIQAGAPYDLVFANILLEPLKRLARPIAQALAPGGRVILSGLLSSQGRTALAVYRAQGLALEARIALEGWTTLVLVRKAESVIPPEVKPR